VMSLQKFRLAFYGIIVLVVAVAAFFVGAFVSKKRVEAKAATAYLAVSPEEVEASRGFVAAALASRFISEHPAALESLRRARDQNPSMTGLDYQLALTYLDLADFDSAAGAAQRSVAKSEELGNAYALLALIALERARQIDSPELAREQIARLVKESTEAAPLNPMPYYVLAEFYRAVGQSELALGAYNQALLRSSKSDGLMIVMVKAGLSGLLLNQSSQNSPLQLNMISGVAPPEQLFFGAADALLRGDKGQANDYLEEVKGRISKETYKAILSDPFFQDYLSGASPIQVPEPETSPSPQG